MGRQETAVMVRHLVHARYHHQRLVEKYAEKKGLAQKIDFDCDFQENAQ